MGLYLGSGQKMAICSVPDGYVKPTSTKTEATYTPSISDQTIASGTYLTGVQTIKGDSNLVAENIAEGVSIFGVTGTHSGSISGGGGSVEMCTLTLIGESPLPVNSMVYYVDGSSSVKSVEPPDFGDSISVVVQKNSIVFSQGISAIPTGDINSVGYLVNGGTRAFFIFGTASITSM